jgi:hypothetical protein
LEDSLDVTTTMSPSHPTRLRRGTSTRQRAESRADDRHETGQSANSTHTVPQPQRHQGTSKSATSGPAANRKGKTRELSKVTLDG